MTAADSYTEYQRRLHNLDGGFSARLAVAMHHAADETRNLPEDLMPAGMTESFYAMTGSAEYRRAQVDAWAARHHVKAKWVPGAGYLARVEDGALSMMAVALPVLAGDVPPSREQEVA